MSDKVEAQEALKTSARDNLKLIAMITELRKENQKLVERLVYAEQRYEKANARRALLFEAVRANQVFHTPVALWRKLPKMEWDEYELDAIRRTNEALSTL